jgi:hypothetical protein
MLASAGNVVGGPIAGTYDFMPLTGNFFFIGEEANSSIIPATCSASFNVRVDAPTGDVAILFALYVNGVDTATTCTLGSADTSCGSITPQAITAGDLVTLHLTGGVDWGATGILWTGLRCQ